MNPRTDTVTSAPPGVLLAGDDEATWYKDAVIYQVHVRAFADADGDGYGDFAGLTKRLGYIQDLGATAIWVMPFYPSPLRDDGYDIADYTDVNPRYGSLADFKKFLAEAHRRGLKVITELVINHTSDQHPWFQRARHAPKGSRWRNFYMWSDDPEQYEGVRIIFQDYEPSNWTWDPVAQQYFWHRFYRHQPDLNFDNPEVQKAVLRALDFWMRLGVDGLRLDAIPYLYAREGTTCENLPETHAFLKKLRAHVDAHWPNRMLLAEANQWPEDAIAYFGDGDECHMAFHFPVMPRLYLAIQQGDRFPIIDVLNETPAIPESCQWAMFLRNHDELTLEMVTDEERDYMYRAYASDPQARVNLGIRRRLAPLLGNDAAKLRLMNGLLFSLPGTPILYYGDEIGMGDNIYLGDRDSVRTPMQWSGDRNAGFSSANPQSLYLPVIVDPEYHYEAVNVEAQVRNTNSLRWWTKRLIALRRRHKAFSRGTLEFLSPHNSRVLAFIRRFGDEEILVVANLSANAGYVELDLHEHRGKVPVELFGQQPFPPIGDLPYLITLQPHGFYWLRLSTSSRAFGRAGLDDAGAAVGMGGGDVLRTEPLPELAMRGAWDPLVRGAARRTLEALLPAFLTRQRWFRSKARSIANVTVADAVAVPGSENAHTAGAAALLTIEVAYTEGEPDTYVVPVLAVTGERAQRVVVDHDNACIARVRARDLEPGAVLCDAFVEASFADALLEVIGRRRRLRGKASEVSGSRLRTPWLAGGWPEAAGGVVSEAEASNTSVIFGDSLILKLYRRIEPGDNPDLEITRFLTDTAGFGHVPRIAGSIERRGSDGDSTLAMLQELIPNEGDVWRQTLANLEGFFDRVLGEAERLDEAMTATVADPAKAFAATRLGQHVEASIVELAALPTPSELVHLIGPYLGTAELIGTRTAELHRALTSHPEVAEFAPEAFRRLDQRALFQAIGSQVRATLALLRRNLDRIGDESVRDLAAELVGREREVRAVLARLNEVPIGGQRIRCHGDYHLGQLLNTGRDVVILDFEGEPNRALSERRIKRSALSDVGSMVRSFEYASAVALDDVVGRGVAELGSPTYALLSYGARVWRRWVAARFLAAYRDGIDGAAFVPADDAGFAALFDAYHLAKAAYEVGYELNNRPDWVRVPLEGMLELLALGA